MDTVFGLVILGLLMLLVVTREGYSGVGLTLLPGTGGLLVTSTQPGPAKLAGIRPGDTILAVDGDSVAGLPFAEAIGRIVGQDGSSVQLRVQRARHTLTFRLVRRRFLAPNILRSLVLAQHAEQLGAAVMVWVPPVRSR